MYSNTATPLRTFNVLYVNSKMNISNSLSLFLNNIMNNALSNNGLTFGHPRKLQKCVKFLNTNLCKYSTSSAILILTCLTCLTCLICSPIQMRPQYVQFPLKNGRTNGKCNFAHVNNAQKELVLLPLSNIRVQSSGMKASKIVIFVFILWTNLGATSSHGQKYRRWQFFKFKLIN